MSFDDVIHIQNVCRHPMEELGYELIFNSTKTKSNMYYLLKSADDLW